MSQMKKIHFLHGMLAQKLGLFLANARRMWPSNAALRDAHDHYTSDIETVIEDPSLLSIPMGYVVDQFHQFFSMNEAQSESWAAGDRAAHAAAQADRSLSSAQQDAIRQQARAAHQPSAAAMRDPRTFFARVAARDESVVTCIHHPLISDSKLGASFIALRKDPAQTNNAAAIFAYFRNMVEAARLTCDATRTTTVEPATAINTTNNATSAAPCFGTTAKLTADQKTAMKLSVVPLAFTMEQFLKNAMLLWPSNEALRAAYDNFEATVLSVITEEDLVCVPMKFVADQFDFFFSMNAVQSEAWAAGERAVKAAANADRTLTVARQRAVRQQAANAHLPSNTALRDARTFFARVASGDKTVVDSIHHPMIADSKLGESFAALRSNPACAHNASAIFAHFQHMVNTANMACVGLRLPTSVVSSSLATSPAPNNNGKKCGAAGRGGGRKRMSRDETARHTAEQVAGIVDALSEQAIAETRRAVEGKTKQELKKMHQSSVDVQNKINSAVRLSEMKKRRAARNIALGGSH